jgi:hypothetical protein
MRKQRIKAGLDFICTECDEVWVLPQSRSSKGVAIATAKSIGVPVKFMRANRKGTKKRATKDATSKRRNSRDLSLLLYQLEGRYRGHAR